METSMKTALPQLIRFNPYNIKSKPITLGTIGATSWSLLPKWVNGELAFLKVSRTDTKGHFKIEATFYILPFERTPTESTFSKYIGDGQTNTYLETKWTTTYTQYEELKGKISISMCAIEDKPSILPQLSNDLGLLNNPVPFPDATLKCGTTKFPVHKRILSIWSSVFAAMFMNGNQDNGDIFTIVDLEEDVIETMLVYIYSGKTDHINNEFAHDILIAADKYKLEELKSICIDKLKSSMTEQNAIHIFHLGHFYDRSLKDSATEFICNCVIFSEMENTEPWKVLKTLHPELAIELLTSFVKYLQ